MRGLLLIMLLVPTVFGIFKPPDPKKLLARDHFFFNVTLVCLVHNWKYKVQFFETDGWFSSNDRLTHASYARGFQGQNNFQMEGYMQGDEALSDGYSPMMTVDHNCMTPGNEEARLNVHILPYCKIGSGECQYEISKHVTGYVGEYTVTSTIDVNPKKIEIIEFKK